MKHKMMMGLLCTILLCGGCGSDKPEKPKQNDKQVYEMSGLVASIQDQTLQVKPDGKSAERFYLDKAELDLGGFQLEADVTVDITYQIKGGKNMVKKLRLLKPTNTMLMNQKIKEIVNQMTLEEKVGQLFFARCPEWDAAAKASQFHLGGFILFGRDFNGENPQSIKATVDSYQNGAKIPLLIGVDEEGGTVNRISNNRAFRGVPFHSPQSLFAEGGFNLITSDTQEKDTLLRSLGINVNFAPVADLPTSSADFIYDRAFGQGADMTGQYVSTVVKQMRTDRVGSVLKHFPGYGNNADTHTGFAIDNRSLEFYRSHDFKPFAAGIQAGADSVLVNHIIVKSMDSNLPASLSNPVHRFLRNELGFQGVIMTDDLEMQAIKMSYGDEEAAILAVKAGNDIVLSTDFEVQIPAVIQAVQNGTLSQSELDQSLIRILKWKLQLGLLSF